MHRIFLVLCVIVLIAGTASSHAQNISLLGHLSIPIGDYGSSSSDDPGNANIGFGAGVEIEAPTEMESFSVIGQVRMIFNPSDDSGWQEYFYYDMSLYWYLIWDAELITLDMDAGRYLNIPVMIGVRSEAVSGPNLKFFIKGLAGLNFSMFPDYKFPMTVYDYYSSEFYAIDGEGSADGTGTTFCYSVSAGLTINDKVDIGLEYLNLGKPEIDGSISISSGGSQIDAADWTFVQSIAMANISIGVKF